MSDGKWSGGVANRTWARPGSRRRGVEGDAERSARLAEQLADERFLCDECGRSHPLREHRTCRERSANRTGFARVLVAAAALAVVLAGVIWLAMDSAWTATP